MQTVHYSLHCLNKNGFPISVVTQGVIVPDLSAMASSVKLLIPSVGPRRIHIIVYESLFCIPKSNVSKYCLES